MSEANGMHRAEGPRAPRVIHVPSPRWLFSPRRGLPLAVVALVGVASVPVDPPFESAQGAQPASTTQVRIAPPADSLRWYDDAEQRDGGWDRIRQVYAVPLPTVADAPAAAAAAVGPVASAASYAGPFAVPTALWAAYTGAAAAMPTSCHLDPRLLAAIGQIESGSLAGRSLDKQHRAVPAVYGPVLDGGSYARIPDTDAGRWDGNRTWDRAVGPMQFIPSTWSRYGRDGDGDGVADPQNIEDAALSAAGYLCAGGRDLAQPDGLRSAILSYNHSNNYLAAVLSLLPGAVPGGADLLFARGSASTAAAASAPTGTAGSAPTAGTPSTSLTTSSTTTSSTTTSTTTSPTTTTSSTTTSSSTTSSSTTTSSDPSSTTTSSTAVPTTSSTTTSRTTTTSSSVTSSSTTTTAPSATTTTPADCDTATATGTATSTGTTTSTTTASSTASPTASPTGGEPTPTGTCSPSPTGSPSPTTTPSAAPSTSSATATEAALLDGRSEPTAD